MKRYCMKSNKPKLHKNKVQRIICKTYTKRSCEWLNICQRMCLEAISSCYYVIITPTIDIRDNFIQMINTNTSLDATQPQPQLQLVECAQVVLVECVAVVLNECAAGFR